MARFLDNIGLAYFWEKIKAWIPFLSRKTQSIPFGQVDSTSTSTVFTATVDGITELRDGVCCYLRNGVVTSASGWTLDINGLGAKPVYQTMADASRTTTIFNINYTFLFVYNSTRVENGCWDVYYGYNTNDDYRAYLVRTGSSTLPAKFKTYRYRLLFTSSDGNYFVGANADTSTNATSVKTPTSEKIDPFGRIVLYATTSAVAADANFSTSYLYQQNTIPLGYSFNSAGGELVLDYPKPVYIKCAPQTDGSAIIDAETPYVQSLPNTEDGKIYIFLGLAYSATNVELTLEHTVYYYKDGAIRIWANEAIQDDTNFVHKAGAETITGEKTFEANVNLTEGATLNLIYDSQTPDGVYLQATEPNGIKAVSFNGISDDGMVQIKNVYVPTNDTDAANKYYVDEEILDIDEYRVYLACRFGPYGVHQKSLCAFCLTNGGREMMMTSFTETSGTGAKEVITDLEFPIGCKIYYNDIMYDLLPNTSGMANRYYTSFNGVDVRYSAITGTNISLGNYPNETQSTVYLHVIVENGYWRPYYKEGATNEIIVDSFHMQSGNFYIYLGKTVRNTGYTIQLEDNNPLYYYDGTDLIDWATYIANVGSSSVLPSGGTTGQVLAKASNADNDVEWVNQKGGYNFAFEIDGLDLKVTYGDSVEEPDFEIVNNNLVVTIE